MSTYELVKVFEPTIHKLTLADDSKTRSSLQSKVLKGTTTASIDANLAIKYARSSETIHDVHVLVATTRRGICAVVFSTAIKDASTAMLSDLKRRFKKNDKISKATSDAGDAHSVSALENFALVEELMSAREPSESTTALRVKLEARLDLHGTQMQVRVWQTLLQIPLGETLTYAQLAENAGLDAKACRAVAQACGANHVSLIVPCHRAVPKSGGLGGYHWGSDLKRKILKSEGVVL